MSAATAKIITLAGGSNPPSSIALFGGTLGERKAVISDLENDLYAAGLSVIDFNTRRFLSESDLSQPLIQQIVTELKANQDTTGATADLVNRINESAPATVSTHLTSENRIELIHQFDSSMKKLAAISLQKKPLVIIVQGLERAPGGSLISISEFISNYLNIHKFMFVVSVGEDILKNELVSSNSQLSSDDFLEDVFSTVVTFVEDEQPKNQEVEIQETRDLFTPPVGLEVESGAEIVKRKKTKVIPKSKGLPRSRIFKVRELSGKKTTIKTGNAPKKTMVKRKIKSIKKRKSRIISKQDENKIDTYMKSVLNGDLFAVKEFWGKVSELNYEEFTELVKKILQETENSNSRVRATAIIALSSISKGVSWEIPSEVMDRALILTNDGSREVKDAAAEAIKELSNAGIEKTPQFKPKTTPEVSQTNNNMELTDLNAESMLGNDSETIGSLSIGGNSGGVKMMGGEKSIASSDTTFEMSETIPSFEEENDDEIPQFKAIEKDVQKFKPVEKEKPKFKIVKD